MRLINNSIVFYKNKKYNFNNIKYFLLFNIQKKYLKYNLNYIYFDNFKIGNILFIEVINYEFFNFRKYFFLGLCISIKKNIILNRLILRNVLGHVLIDQQFIIFNNLLLNIRKSKKRLVNLGSKKSKLFFLKNLPFFFRINKLVISETFFYSLKKKKIFKKR
jgi:ribosomal protein L19